MRQRCLGVAAILMSAGILAGCGSFSTASHAPPTAPSSHARGAMPAPLQSSVFQVTFSVQNPADGWMVVDVGSTPALYRTTDEGRNWQRIVGVIPNALGSILVIGSHVWVPTTAPHHALTLAFSGTPGKNWVSQPLQATTQAVPWDAYANVVMPQTTTGTPWLLAASLYLGMTELYTLFRYDTHTGRWVAVVPMPLGQRGDESPGLAVTGRHTLWWASGGNGTQAQLDQVAVAHGRATIRAATLPGWPVTSPCGRETVNTDRRVGVPAFHGPTGRVMASWDGCHKAVHVATWTTTNGGQQWDQGAALPTGAFWGRWASPSVGYVWSASGERWWTTTDGGQTWSSSSLPAPLQRLDVVTSQDLWAIAGSGQNHLLHSSDAGLHWTTVPLPSPN